MEFDLTTTELALALAAGVVGAGYIAFILVPAWSPTAGSGARRGELLTLFTLATLLGIGARSDCWSSGRTTDTPRVVGPWLLQKRRDAAPAPESLGFLKRWTRSRTRSSPAPGCRRSRAPRAAPSTRA